MATWVVAKRGHGWFAYEDGAPASEDRRFADRASAIAWCRARGYAVRADPEDAGVTLSPGDNGGGDLLAPSDARAADDAPSDDACSIDA